MSSQILTGSVGVCLTFDQTRSHQLLPLHQRRKHDQPNPSQTSPSLPPKKIANLGLGQIFSIGTPILCLPFATKAPWCRLNIRWCITNQVQRPHRFSWTLVTTHGKTWWDVFLTPVHSETSTEQPATIVGSRPNLQVILLGGIEGIHNPNDLFLNLA